MTRALFVYHAMTEGGLSVDVRNMAGALAERGWDAHVATVGRVDQPIPAMPAGVQVHTLRPLRLGRRAGRWAAVEGLVAQVFPPAELVA